jgi:hypothetical protein
MKTKLAILLMGLALMARPAGASDLTRGVTFTDGQRLYAAQLHQLVDNTSIAAAFYTGQSAETTLPTGDLLLVYSPTLLGYRKITAQNALYGNTALITGQTEKTALATNDYVLLYDTSGGVLKKASLANISLNATNLIAGQPAVTNLSSTAQLLVLNNGTNASITASNLFWSLETWNKPFTNLLTHTAPTNQDRLLIWDSTAGTNKTTTLGGLVTNLPLATLLTNTDSLLIFSTSTNSGTAGTNLVARTTMQQLLTLVSNNIVAPLFTNTPVGGAKVQVNFIADGGTGSCTLNGASINVSNVNRISQGHYLVQWTNAVANTNYLVLLSGFKTAAQDQSFIFVTNKTTLSCGVLVQDESPTQHDLHEVYVYIP